MAWFVYSTLIHWRVMCSVDCIIHTLENWVLWIRVGNPRLMRTDT